MSFRWVDFLQLGILYIHKDMAWNWPSEEIRTSTLHAEELSLNSYAY